MKHGSLLHLTQSVKDRILPERFLGRQVGKYRVIRLLGSGAFAWVYEAVDQDLEIPVALKILRPEFAGELEAEARFRKEAATAARLRHPNIVTVRDVGRIDGASFVAMDLLPLSLARRLELMPRLPEHEVVRIGLDVAAALAIAHAGGVVHRDIKPDNILIGTHGEAVVADFGLARALDGNAGRSGAQQVTGTPHYFSPEQARGLEVDGRSDLYSLGVTLFRAATGRLPFEGDDWYAVARMHVDTPPPSARSLEPGVTEAFDSVVGRLLQKAPADRFSSALAVVDALAALPSAPSPRSTNSTSPTPNETVIAFPVVSAPVASLRLPKMLAITALGAVMLAVATWAVARRSPLSGVIDSRSTSPIATAAESLAVAPRDSATTARRDSTEKLARADTINAASAIAARPRNLVRQKSEAIVRTQLTISAPELAMMYVDGALVGSGTKVIERPGAARFALRAVIADAPAECATAVRDSVVRLAVGEIRAITLAVRTCLGVSFTIVPRDARIRFESLDGGSSVEVRADTAKAVLLPEGRYEVRATAPRCMEYRGDTLDVRRGASAAELRRNIPMDCR